MKDEQIREMAEKAAERAACLMDGNVSWWEFESREHWVRRIVSTNVNSLNRALRILDAAGFTVLPKEATEEMMRAGYGQLPWPGPNFSEALAGDVYRAMLAAYQGDDGK